MDLNISTRPTVFIKNSCGQTINKTNPITYQFTKANNCKLMFALIFVCISFDHIF